MNDEQLNEDIEIDVESNPESVPETPPQYGVGPFSIREVALAGVWLVAFVVSFFSVSALRFDSVWTSGLLWILTIGVPTAAVFLIVLRRLSPDGIRRVGSLGIDQFASVAFSVSAVLWIQLLWESIAIVVADGPWVRSWVMWVQLVMMLAGVVLTVLAPFIPVICEDFRDRREVPAHRNARPIRPISARPAPEARPAVVEPETHPTGEYQPVDFAAAGFAASENAYAPASADFSDTGAQAAGWDSADQSAAEQTYTGPQPTTSHQAFWALVPVDRDVYDESGAPIFRVGPTAWALVIEDRGSAFVVRHEDGRVGYLHDVSGVTRG